MTVPTQASDRPPARHVRFTLRVLFVFVAVIALVATWVSTYRVAQRNRLLEVEIRRLRNDFGELSVEDETRFHAIGVATNNELEWAWRIWIPEGHRYHLRVAGGPVPKEGFPRTGYAATTISKPGEHEVRYHIRRDPRDNRWYGWMSTSDGMGMGKFAQPWVEWNSRNNAIVSVGRSTTDFAPDKCVVLVRHRVSQPDSTYEVEDPAAGFLIWLEPN